MAERFRTRVWRAITNIGITGTVGEQAVSTYSYLSGGSVVLLGWFSDMSVVWIAFTGFGVAAFVFAMLYYYNRNRLQYRASTEAAPTSEVAVRFGSPVQRAQGHSGSTWCIPIILGSGADANNFRASKVRAKVANGLPDLAWGDAKQGGQAKETIALNSKMAALVQVIERDEPSEEATAWLMTQQYHNIGGEPKYSYLPDRTVHRLKLVVYSDDGTSYESPHWYRFRVPAVVSNGQFTLEIEYDVLG